MISLNFLYYSLGIGFLALVGFMCYCLYYLAINLKTIKEILENIEDVTRNIDLVGNQIKLSALNIFKGFLSKGGDIKHGKRQKSKGMNPLAAGAIGAGIGVLAGAATVALSDEGNRKKLGKKIAEMEEKVKDAAMATEKKVKDLESEGAKKLKGKTGKKQAK